MIDMNHKYQTRDGRAVRILATDLNNIFSVVGIITEPTGSEHIFSWQACGRADGELSGQLNRLSDLIPAPTKHGGWILVSKGGVILGADTIYERIAICSQPFRGETIHEITWEA